VTPAVGSIIGQAARALARPAAAGNRERSGCLESHRYARRTWVLRQV